MADVLVDLRLVERFDLLRIGIEESGRQFPRLAERLRIDPVAEQVAGAAAQAVQADIAAETIEQAEGAALAAAFCGLPALRGSVQLQAGGRLAAAISSADNYAAFEQQLDSYQPWQRLLREHPGVAGWAAALAAAKEKATDTAA